MLKFLLWIHYYSYSFSPTSIIQIGKQLYDFLWICTMDLKGGLAKLQWDDCFLFVNRNWRFSDTYSTLLLPEHLQVTGNRPLTYGYFHPMKYQFFKWHNWVAQSSDRQRKKIEHLELFFAFCLFIFLVRRVNGKRNSSETIIIQLVHGIASFFFILVMTEAYCPLKTHRMTSLKQLVVHSQRN